MSISTIISIAFIASCVVAFVAWCFGVICSVLVVFNTKPGAVTGWFRLNSLVMFFPDKLTPKGLLLRRWSFIGAGVFVVACLLVFALGKLADT